MQPERVDANRSMSKPAPERILAEYSAVVTQGQIILFPMPGDLNNPEIGMSWRTCHPDVPRIGHMSARYTCIGTYTSYIAPGSTYIAPGFTYIAPGFTYIAPGSTYVAPGSTYIGPSQLDTNIRLWPNRGEANGRV